MLISPALPLLLLLLFSGCSGKNVTADYAAAADSADSEPHSAAAGDSVAGAADAEEPLRREAARVAAALDDQRLAAQVIISGIDGKERLSPDMKLLLTECPAGGIVLFRYNLNAGNDAIRSLIAEAVTLIDIAPFVAVDHEGGTVNRFRPGVADLPPAVSYREEAEQGTRRAPVISRIFTDSFNAGNQINALGINVNLAPVAECLNEHNRDFLDDRSYGPDVLFTVQAAGAFISGMNQAGVLCAVKHFPGSAGPDPHLFPSVLTGDKAALAELILPFASLIRNNHIRAIMVSHSAVPAWDNENIASLSSAVMDGWLRRELNFDGIIICDDFSMASARSPDSARDQDNLKPERLVVRSLAAGADMILVWPPDLRRTHRAIMEALDSGELSRGRLEESVQRIVLQKLRMKLIDGNRE